jgi:hypothetical protein
MMNFNFNPGSRVLIDGVPFHIVSQDGEERRLVSSRTHQVRRHSYDDLARLYVGGHLVGDIPGAGDGARSRLLEDLLPPERERVEFRLAFLNRVSDLMTGALPGEWEATLHRALALASAELDHSPPVSRAAYFNWKAALRRADDVCALAGRFHDRGRRRDTDVVRELAREIWAEALEDARRAIAFRTPSWLVAEFEKRLRLRNAALAAAGETPVTRERSSIYALFTQFPAQERDLLRHGVQKTRAFYRAPSSHRGSFGELPLDLNEYDGTRSPIFLFDDISLLPLGRPWCAGLVDFRCDAPVGFYFGFEGSGDATFASTLRHACLPKTYVAEEYPDIANRYPLHGKARRYTLDNELSAHAATVDLITKDLLSSVGVAPSRTPWWKPKIEGFFSQLNEMLLRELPGYVLARELSPEEYNPTRNGCLGLRYFLYLFHVWLIDVYLQTPGPSGKTPAELWQEGTATWAPDLIASASDLDLLFGIVREGRLDHRGVVYEHLWYHSEELQELRVREGHTQHPRVKVNPNDLQVVHVFDERRRLWVRAKARDADYATGLTLHRHTLNLKNAAPGPVTIQRLREAEAWLRGMIAEAAQMTLSIQTAGLAARATGIGTQHIFNHLDVDGHLGPFSGPLQGQSLNPFGSPSAPPEAAPAPPPAHPRMRKVPVLQSDHSLSREDNTR